MSLFIRLDIGFWTHRKTARLRATLGESALWLPVRLWSYAAQNQPDGDFSDYSAEELALLLAYPLSPQAMLQALQACGFLDGMKIHGWADHNGYHEKFSDRAKKAAAERWKGHKKKDRGKDKRGEETSIACSIADASSEVMQAWNALPEPFPKVRTMSEDRRREVRTRMKDEFWASSWRGAIAMLPESSFAKGQNDRNWIANLDFFLQPGSVAKIIEGKYASGRNGNHQIMGLGI